MSRAIAAAKLIYQEDHYWIRIGKREYLVNKDGDIFLTRSEANLNYGRDVAGEVFL